MNSRNIKAALNSRGIEVLFRFTRAGTVADIPVGNNLYLTSLLPIDDGHDMRFCDFLEAQLKKYREGTWVATTTQEEIEGSIHENKS